MKKRRFSEDQIVGALKEAEAGVPVKELCRRIGISDATFYHWKAKYGGLEVNEARRLRQLGACLSNHFSCYRLWCCSSITTTTCAFDSGFWNTQTRS